jgi:DNA-binding MarR family transcriptional regulator
MERGAVSGESEQQHWDVPWPAPTSQAERPERAELEAAFATELRRTGALIQLMGQAAADTIGINPTDLNCLNILSLSGQMTAGQLARATGLTTASITGVVDRLEEAGYVRRVRDTIDRRRVHVQIVPERVVADVARVFLPMIGGMREISSGYGDGELRLIVEVYERVGQLIREQIAQLRGSQRQAGA